MAQNLLDSILTTESARSASHRPDLSIPAARREIIETAIRSWHFPAQSFSMDELTYGALYMLEHMLHVPELETCRIPRPQLMTFLLATRRQYKHSQEVHYHNWRHAVDVTQSIYCFLLDIRLCPPLPDDARPAKTLNAVERALTPVDGLMLLVSAIGHDVGHPGVNNAFLVACNHPLAQMYNDKSVLENYHCAAYSQLLRRHWPSLSGMSGFRSTLISNILATDMQRHFEYMASLGDLKRKIGDSRPDLSDWAQTDWNHARELIMALLMKAADISNVARPFDISAQWARTLMNEFARQGELEHELSIPTCLFGGPPDKEDALAAAQSQKGFMSLFGIPLFAGMHDVMPSMSCAINELQVNDEQWDKKIAAEKQRRAGDVDQSHLTFSSVTEDEVEAAKIRHHRSEPFAVPEVVPHVPSSPIKRKTVLDPTMPPPSHPASALQHHLTLGGAGHRASNPVLPAPAIPTHPPPVGGASRRSSKDVALDSLQHHHTFAHTDLSSSATNAAHHSSPASRRGSNDASWAVHQSCPGSRRGSKDESLTTILVTSQGSPRRASPSSPGKMTPPRTGTMAKADLKQDGVKRQSISGASPPAATAPPPPPPPTTTKDSASARYSHPSSRSHTMSSATVTTTATQHSPSTQPSSLAPTDDEATPPAAGLPQHPILQGNHVLHHMSPMNGEDDPFLAHHLDGNGLSGTWSSTMDGTPHHASAPMILTPSPKLAPKSDTSPRIIARVASAESSDDHGRLGLLQRKGDRGGSSAGSVTAGSTTSIPLRESRSRSRLRGLRNFWRKTRNRDASSGVEAGDGSAGPAGGTSGSGGSGSP